VIRPTFRFPADGGAAATRTPVRAPSGLGGPWFQQYEPPGRHPRTSDRSRLAVTWEGAELPNQWLAPSESVHPRSPLDLVQTTTWKRAVGVSLGGPNHYSQMV
jgi:hypothetical protein